MKSATETLTITPVSSIPYCTSVTRDAVVPFLNHWTIITKHTNKMSRRAGP